MFGITSVTRPVPEGGLKGVERGPARSVARMAWLVGWACVGYVGRRKDMTSGRVRAPVLVAGDAALDASHPFGQLVEVAAQRLEGGIWRRLASAFSGEGRAVGDEDSPALVGLHELFLAEDSERVVDRHRRDTVPAGQLSAGRQSFAWLECPGRDACPKIVGHLQIRRPRIVRIWLHASRVSRSSCLGRIRDVPGGLLQAYHSSSMICIALEQSS